jgi:hypothetical protein
LLQLRDDLGSSARGKATRPCCQQDRQLDVGVLNHDIDEHARPPLPACETHGAKPVQFLSDVVSSANIIASEVVVAKGRGPPRRDERGYKPIEVAAELLDGLLDLVIPVALVERSGCAKVRLRLVFGARDNTLKESLED